MLFSESLATFANSIDLEPVGDDGKVVFPRGGHLQLLDDGLVELHDLSALNADQMVMVLCGLGFVAAELVVEPVLLDKSLFLEGVEGAIDGGQSDPRGLGADQPVDLLRAQVALGLGEGLEDPQTLLRGMNPGGPKILGQPLHGSRRGILFPLPGRRS